MDTTGATEFDTDGTTCATAPRTGATTDATVCPTVEVTGATAFDAVAASVATVFETGAVTGATAWDTGATIGATVLDTGATTGATDLTIGATTGATDLATDATMGATGLPALVEVEPLVPAVLGVVGARETFTGWTPPEAAVVDGPTAPVTPFVIGAGAPGTLLARTGAALGALPLEVVTEPCDPIGKPSASAGCVSTMIDAMAPRTSIARRTVKYLRRPITYIRPHPYVHIPHVHYIVHILYCL